MVFGIKSAFSLYPLPIFLFGASLFFFAYLYRKQRKSYRSLASYLYFKSKLPSSLSKLKIRIFYATSSGTSKRLAQSLREDLIAIPALVSGGDPQFEIVNLRTYDPEDELERDADSSLCVFLLSTAAEGAAPPDARWFAKYVCELGTEHRVSRRLLERMRFAVVGFGDSAYRYADVDLFCAFPRAVDAALLSLSARPIVPLCLIDQSDTLSIDEQFSLWTRRFTSALCESAEISGDTRNLDSSSSCCSPSARPKATCCRSSGIGASGDSTSCSCSHGSKRAQDNHLLRSRLFRVGSSSSAATSANERHACAPIANQVARTREPDDDSCENTSGEEDAAAPPNLEAEQQLVDELMALDPEQIGLYAGATKAQQPQVSNGLLDVEDLGAMVNSRVSGARSSKAARRVRRAERATKSCASESESEAPAEAAAAADARPMVGAALRGELEKQGYRVVGSHSGVKLCRWTKSTLRGRGGCYKHTFYGIESHRCVETTPSMACANKCVFCWRHHTNPVATEWKWDVDEPQMILDRVLEQHAQMIREFRGVPGVLPERLHDALYGVRHCALSLVGEPIFYPRINELLALLHSRRISSFLVTNAQFPEAIARLPPVTQLYLSIDASTRSALRRIDRPLFRDFWERFLASIDALAARKQRTVFRLTLVKEWNTEEVAEYAALVRRGRPDLVEVKGVTYCGTSAREATGAAPLLTLRNVPWFAEVKRFSDAIADQLRADGYELACVHEHSNCILIAKTIFLVDGVWHTWINFDRFQDLYCRYEKDGTEFSSIDYMERTPSWALNASDERGFDPADKRIHPNKIPQNGC